MEWPDPNKLNMQEFVWDKVEHINNAKRYI